MMHFDGHVGPAEHAKYFGKPNPFVELCSHLGADMIAHPQPAALKSYLRCRLTRGEICISMLLLVESLCRS